MAKKNTIAEQVRGYLQDKWPDVEIAVITGSWPKAECKWQVSHDISHADPLHALPHIAVAVSSHKAEHGTDWLLVAVRDGILTVKGMA
jgi:hypothetical protein